MTHVATLIVDPARPSLREAHVRQAGAALPACGSPRWLAPEIAADLPFAPPAGVDNRDLVAALREALGGAPIDVVIQPAGGRRKRLLLADMDSTLIRQECIDELADALGLRERVAAITERSMRGEVGFETSLRERVALLRGLDVETAARIVAERVSLMPGARALAATMRANGAVTAIASGGFTLFTARVAETLGFDSHFANTLMLDHGKLSGALEEPVLGPDAKRQVLQGLCYAHGLRREETLAVGDGANDRAMLMEAGIGVAFRAKPVLAEIADARIEHGDLTALLYLQGYSRDDILS